MVNRSRELAVSHGGHSTLACRTGWGERVRIDPADLADEPDDAHAARYVRSASDGPNAAGKDQGETVGGDALPDSSSVILDPALRLERAAAYRATVDATYRQYAMDRGYARVEQLEREHDADGTGYATVGTAAADVQAGARGPASRRDFDPESAGGPIRQLDARKASITNEGVQEVAAHLRRFTGGGPLDTPEQGMLDRLTSIAAGAMEPTSYDLNFYTHELDEAGRYAELGFEAESGVDLGSSEMYEVWNNVHTAALEDYGIRDTGLFHPGLAS